MAASAAPIVTGKCGSKLYSGNSVPTSTASSIAHGL